MGEDGAGLYRPVVAMAGPEDSGQDRGCCVEGDGSIKPETGDRRPEYGDRRRCTGLRFPASGLRVRETWKW